jgi:hypothetical protein
MTEMGKGPLLPQPGNQNVALLAEIGTSLRTKGKLLMKGLGGLH